ncbi:MAG: hypothetical protein QW404_00090 [Candidatus Nanoarchaeia archaeon]
MNKKAQTEDIFADLIPSIILITIGIFVIYYFSYQYTGELDQNEIMIQAYTDRESFSIEGMMNHKVMDLKFKEHKIIDVIDMYATTQSSLDKFNYETMIREGVNEYLEMVKPTIKTCFIITLITQDQKSTLLVKMCELNPEIKKVEEALIPLPEGNYAKIRMEYGAKSE